MSDNPGLLGLITGMLIGAAITGFVFNRTYDGWEAPYLRQIEACESRNQTISMALAHANTGDVVVTSGSSCVISADPDLDEATFMGYLTSCRRGWDLRRQQKQTENEQ